MIISPLVLLVLAYLTTWNKGVDRNPPHAAIWSCLFQWLFEGFNGSLPSLNNRVKLAVSSRVINTRVLLFYHMAKLGYDNAVVILECTKDSASIECLFLHFRYKQLYPII